MANLLNFRYPTLMKKLLIISLTLLLNTNVHSLCNEDYQVIQLLKKNRSSAMSTTGIAMPPTAVGLFSTAYNLAGTLGPVAGPLSATTVVGMTYGTPLVSTTAVFNYFSAKRYLWVKAILDQSLVGFGRELTEYIEDLSFELDREISVESFTKVVNAANSEEVFCQKDNKLFTPTEFKDYIESRL
ncbi:MAG: hypothetical protein CME61_06310 [Halobacteriovoraceae bacterium]|nr:hypothetical protein [Halobacteriovoraceae bacterium]